jgi:UDP-N-acetylmuramoylalanine--D-glutamate ligase
MDDYVAAKANIFRNQTSNDYTVLPAADERVSKMDTLTEARTIFFSRRRELDEGIFLRGPALIYRSSGVECELITRDEIMLRGDHNLENVMSALAIGIACGASAESMRAGVRNFKGVEHRLEFVAEINGVKFYNDSKATNVDAAIKCIEAFDGGVNVILGGKDKGGDYAPLAPVARAHCSNLILIGAAADKIAAALQGTRPLRRASTMEEAVEIGLKIGKPGEIVLLTPACASFDMFDNYEHRGRVFKEAVRKLESGE